MYTTSGLQASGQKRLLAVTNGVQLPVGRLIHQVGVGADDVHQVVYEADQYVNPSGTRSHIGLGSGTADPAPPFDAVVLAPTSAASMGMGRLADMGPRVWLRGVEAPIFAAVEVIQELRPLLRAPGGCLIMMLPSLSIAGESGEVGFCTSTEAHRILARSLAGIWCSDGLAVHTVLLPTRWFTQEPNGTEPPDEELPGALRWLIDHGKSGHTINLDPAARNP